MSDRIFGCLVIVAALAFIASATTIQTSFLMDPVGPKLFPMLIGGVATICAIGMLIKPDANPDWPGLATLLKLAFAVAVLVAYAYSLKRMGFLIPTALAAGILSYQIQPRVLQAIATGLLLSIGLFLIFKYALGLGLVPLPKSWMS